jgi:hypothetical protein
MGTTSAWFSLISRAFSALGIGPGVPVVAVVGRGTATFEPQPRKRHRDQHHECEKPHTVRREGNENRRHKSSYCDHTPGRHPEFGLGSLGGRLALGLGDKFASPSPIIHRDVDALHSRRGAEGLSIPASSTQASMPRSTSASRTSHASHGRVKVASSA